MHFVTVGPILVSHLSCHAIIRPYLKRYLPNDASINEYSTVNSYSTVNGQSTVNGYGTVNRYSTVNGYGTVNRYSTLLSSRMFYKSRTTKLPTELNMRTMDLNSTTGYVPAAA